ncbi:hypothetical protein DPMN_121510 [Dreissena polymorpha]|uniref:Uncharacterized protein n=1 Tax=Dreissena polymorpha TaxID=45954 RepID=A0A9D4GLR7_DREPO|nr:hypothetical protein DPMN_121510 [Dreissena polymorpha]
MVNLHVNDGAGVVNYMIASSELFDHINDFQVLNRGESDHFPITCHMYSETDDDVFCAKKERLLHEMRRNGLVFDHVSQHNFADRATHSTEHTDIVIIVSKGMNALCSPLREQQQEWDHANLPKTVLFELQHAKVGEYVVHLVSLEHDRFEGERLLSQFRGLLVYPKPPEGGFIYDYNFHGNGFDFIRGMPFEDFINKLLT